MDSEGVMCKKKAIALSFAFYDRDFASEKIQCACQMGKDRLLCTSLEVATEMKRGSLASNVIEHLWKLDAWPEEGLYNINVPVVNELRPVHLTTFHKTSYGSLFRPLVDTTSSISTANNDDTTGELVEQEVRNQAEGHESGQTIYHFAPDFKTMNFPMNAAPGSDAWALHHRFVSGSWSYYLSISSLTEPVSILVTPMVASYQVAHTTVDYGFENLNKL